MHEDDPWKDFDRVNLLLLGSDAAENRMGVDQLLFVKPLPTGRSGMPATRRRWDVTA